jgi:hypothetical protein
VRLSRRRSTNVHPSRREKYCHNRGMALAHEHGHQLLTLGSNMAVMAPLRRSLENDWLAGKKPQGSAGPCALGAVMDSSAFNRTRAVLPQRGMAFAGRLRRGEHRLLLAGVVAAAAALSLLQVARAGPPPPVVPGAIAVPAGRGAGARQPVQRDVVDDVVPGEIAHGLAVDERAGELVVAVRVVVEHPGRQPDG